MAGKITIIDKQNLLDIALQASGTIESVFEIALQNQVSITDEVAPGVGLMIPDGLIQNKDVLNYYIQQTILPATGSNNENLGVEVLEGIDYWAIGDTFIVS